MSIRTRIGWRAKIAGKIVLARLPVPYRIWRRVGIFRHGQMRSGAYAIRVFEHALDHARLPSVQGMHVLELGPGDSLFSAVLARAAGAAGSIHVDIGRFADRDPEHYREFARLIDDRGYAVVDLASVTSLEDVLERCRARYLTGGLASLRELPSETIDFAWSQSTIEHISAREVPSLLRELRRVTAPGGVAVHLIDLRDHLADGLNSLRFSSRVWESRLMAGSGFYTNRLRLPALLDLFAGAGFRAEVVRARRWAEPPIPRARLAAEFRGVADEDLRVATVVVRLTPR